MTASAETFLRTATASASFLRLPAASQAQITAHAARFGRPGPVEAKAAALAAGRVGDVMALIKQGHEILASQPATASTTSRSVPTGTMSRDAFDKLSHAERNQFIRAGGKLTESPRVKNAFAAFQQSRANA